MKLRKIAILLCATIAISCSSDDISGSGTLTTESRELNAFTSVSVTGIANVNITQGDSQTLEITADSNVMDYLRTEVDNGSLSIYLASGHNYKNITVQVEVMAKGLNGVTNEGSGSIKILDVENPDFYINNKGSADISLSGTSNTLTVENEGSGRISGYSFFTDTSEIDIVGSGDVEISCSDQLHVEIDGSGNVFYKGNPTISSKIEGSGKVINSN
ncbi:head GIN domain-containing protein [Flagellimonas oceanensis]|uniref:head GIN domain-containing protein n=1 Tax=Flagellimonas oceanensis TaxID=2499163 RepID=UPI0013DFA316|nr:head GIN domain-containing protein [Allomuricauda oceanensis]